MLFRSPRQIRVYQAMGVDPSLYPVFAHLPFVMGTDNAKLSKRNGEVSIAWYRDKGFLPEAICNYLALLGWSPGDDKENISLAEMAEIFEVERVGKNPARFDMKKLESINAEKIRGLTIDELTNRAIPFVERAGIAIESGSESKERKDLLAKAMPLIQERIVTLEEVPQYVRFLFVDQISIDPDSAAKILTPDAMPILAAAEKALIELAEWTLSAIDRKSTRLNSSHT